MLKFSETTYSALLCNVAWLQSDLGYDTLDTEHELFRDFAFVVGQTDAPYFLVCPSALNGHAPQLRQVRPQDVVYLDLFTSGFFKACVKGSSRLRISATLASMIPSNNSARDAKVESIRQSHDVGKRRLPARPKS